MEGGKVGGQVEEQEMNGQLLGSVQINVSSNAHRFGVHISTIQQ